ncbi:MAG TPA: 2-oxoacid:ferredoxin oxidoreductase subunit beta [Candidatus Thermoplasmatota archaeon]|nr:2-oxoacid:ferredoxin oxidoreductase subunit beta [Candidatus Thermoplasmatota archaeon]
MAATETRVKRDIKDWQTAAPSWWCPGCGDFGVLAAMQRALANRGLNNEEVVVVSGIGCSGKITGYINSYSYHSLHGRATPPAQAIKLANKDLTVIVAGGDGDGYGIGAGHFVHAVRRNVDLTYIVMDNNIYGLTKGQVSPTSGLGFVTATTPEGNQDQPVNPLALFLAAGGTFLAQGFSGDMKGLTAMIEAAIEHKGFSLINVFSPCVTFNKKNTYAWYRDVLVDVNSGEEIKHDPSNKQMAMQRALDGRIYSGILYQEKRPSYIDHTPTLQGPALASLKIEDKSQWNYAAALEEFR